MSNNGEAIIRETFEKLGYVIGVQMQIPDAMIANLGAVLQAQIDLLAELQSTGRLLADDEMRLTAEQVDGLKFALEAVTSVADVVPELRGTLSTPISRLVKLLRALFPATEPAEEVKPVHPKPDVGDWGYGGGAAVYAPEVRGKTREELLSEKVEQLQAQVKHLSRVAVNAAEHGIKAPSGSLKPCGYCHSTEATLLHACTNCGAMTSDPWSHPTPAEPAEEETKAEVVEPRIWGINTPEPSDVQYVRDRFGSLFKRFAPNVWHRWLPADERFGAADWTWVELASDLPVEVLGVPHELADTKPAEEKSEPEAEAAEICGEFIRLRSRPNICTQPKGHDDDHFNPADLTPFGPVHADKAYPYAEGDHTVLGPEIFTDGYAICWKGEAYVKASMPSSVDELTEAIRFTVEYVGLETLPPTEGWSWYDALLKYAPEKAKAFLDAETGPWETWEAVPEGVAYRSMNGSGVEWFNRDNNRYVRSPGGKSHLSGVDDDDMNTNLAPFVAAEEGWT